MRTLHEYESMDYFGYQSRQLLAEVYSGADVVGWYERIRNQLEKQLDEQESTRNYEYADKIREFLKVWRENEITGSVNRETLMTLKAAAQMLAVGDWSLKTYFAGLRGQLSKLVASEEELPRGIDFDQNDPMAGGSLHRPAPPMNPSFGPDKEKPPGLEPDEGAEAGQDGAAPNSSGVIDPGKEKALKNLPI